MKISIITINYNNALGLKKTINSVIEQTYKDIEYIIIDGGSTDTSVEIIKNNTNFISYWISEKDEGVYDAMNKGLNEAKSSYCLFLNSGDTFLNPNNLKEVIEFIKDEPHHDIYYGDIIVHNVETNRDVQSHFPEQISLNFLFFNSIGHQSSFISTKLLKTHNGYDTNFKIISDWIFYVNAFLDKAKFKKIPLTISIFESGGLSSNADGIIKEGKIALDKYFPHLIADYEYLSKLKLKADSANNSLLKRFLRKIKSKIIHK